MAGLKFDITGDNGNMLSALQGVQNGVRQTQRVVEQSGQGIEQVFGKIQSAATAAMGAFSAQQFASKVMSVRGEFQQLEVAFETMLGSAEEAKRLMNQLVKTAATTPFDLQGIAQGAKQLLAYGTSANEVNEILVRLGDIAAGLSVPLGDLVYLYGTTMVQGRLFSKDLHQFTGRGIPIAKEITDQFGVAEDKILDLVEAGKVGAAEVKKAIISMTSEGGKFGGLMEKQSHTITGQISNIEDAIDGMFNEIGKKSDGIINTGLGTVSKLVENWETVARVLGTVAAAYGISKAAIVAYNVYQTIHNRLLQEAALQSKLAAMNNITLSNSEAMAAARTTLFSASIKGLTAAIATNPVGALTVGLTALLSVIQLVNTDTDKMAVYTDKFGKDAATTLTTLDTYANTLLGLSDGHDKLKLSGSTSKKVLEELNSILADYGVTQIKEGDNIDVVNAKREQAIQLIKEESIERQRLNDIDAVSQEYQQAIQDAQNQLVNDLSNAVYNKTGDTLLNKIFGSADEIRENASAISMIIGDVVRNNMNLIVNKSGEEYEKGMDKIRSKIQERMKTIGFSDEAINNQWADNGLFKADEIVQKYVDSMQNATETQERHLDMVNKSADAERTAASASMDYGDKVAALERKLQGPTDGVHQLYKNIKELMSQYKDNTIGFHINFDGQFPSWMGKMGIPELERLSKRFAAIGANLKDDGVAIVNGKRYTKQQALQRSADYAEAAEDKQSKKDAADKEAKRKAEEAAKEAEKNKKKYASEAKRKAEEAKREQERIAEETRNRNKAIKGYEESVLEQQKETELALRQQNIDLKEESYEKEIEQINLNYDRLIAENEKRRKGMIEALKDNKVNEWLNQNPKATKEQQENYRNSLNLGENDLNDTQRRQLAEYGNIADRQRRKSLSELLLSQRSYLNDYLKEYGSFEEKKLAIAREYDEKIRKSGSVGEKASLEMQRDKEIEKVANDELRDSIDWNGVFSDLQGHTKQYLQGLRDQLQGLLDAGNLPVDQMQTVSEKINAIDDELGKQQGLWDFIGERAREHNRLIKEAADAQERLTVAKDKESEAALSLTSIREEISEMLSNVGQDINIEDISTSTLADKMDFTNEKFNGMVPILQRLATAEGKLVDARKKVTETTNKAKQKEDAAKRDSSQAIADWFSDAQEFISKKGIDQLPELFSTLGLEKLGEKASHGLDAFNSGANAAKDFASKNYIGAALNGIKAISSVGKMFGIGASNHEKQVRIQEEIAKRIEILNSSIDRLTDQLGKSYGAEAISTKEALDKMLVDNQSRYWAGLKAAGDDDYGGRHSDWHHWNRNTRQMSRDIAKYYGIDGVVGWQELFENLSKMKDGEGARILDDIRENHSLDWWYTMQTQGYNEGAMGKWLDQWADSWDKIEEASVRLKEQLTGTTEDNVFSDFMNSLNDLANGSEDVFDNIADNWQKMVNKMVLNNIVGSKYQEQLKKWYNDFSKVYDDKNIDKDELSRLKSAYDNIVRSAKDEIEGLRAIGLVEAGNFSQSASSRGFGSMSQDDSKELSGRFLALQVAGESISEQVLVAVQVLNELASFSSSSNTAVSEIRNMMLKTTSYLEDVAKYTKSMYNEFGAKLDNIVLNTRYT